MHESLAMGSLPSGSLGSNLGIRGFVYDKMDDDLPFGFRGHMVRFPAGGAMDGFVSGSAGGFTFEFFFLFWS